MKKFPLIQVSFVVLLLLSLSILSASHADLMLQAQTVDGDDVSENNLFLPLFSGPATGTEATVSETAQQEIPSVQADGQQIRAADLSNIGQWSDVISMPLIPVGAANLPNGKILTWAAHDRYKFGENINQTYTAIFDPATNSSTEWLVENDPAHDMFCPGTSNLADGRILISGGSSNTKTSIYNYASNEWTASQELVTGRGYHAQTVLPSGDVFTIGGSWSGDIEVNKGGELWREGTGWSQLTGLPIDPILDGVSEEERIKYRDNHAWLWTAPNGKVFHAGPASNMHWLDTAGSGSYSDAGPRGDDEFSIKGTTVMYDVGKILKIGGAFGYTSTVEANNRAYIIDINSDNATVKRVQDLNQGRTMHNSVVLPNGQVLAVGGIATARVFEDDGARFIPELWDPITEQWTDMAAMVTPRTYHSIAILLPDGRVLAGGGGLCGTQCGEKNRGKNHPDVEIFSPPYLFNGNEPAVRPVITSAPSSADYGDVINVATNSAVTSFSLVRLSSVTHSTNNDQRRIPLTPTTAGANSYNLALSNNRSVLLPGYYMLFAMNAAGTPSVSTTIQIGVAQPEANPTCAEMPTDVDYHIVARHSGKGLAVENASTSDGANIIQATTTNAENDNWRLQSVGEGYYHIIAQHSGKAANVEGGSQADGASVIQWPAASDTNDDWCFQPTDGGYYTVVARHSGQVMDVFGASIADGADIIQWPDESGGNQQWKLEPISGISTLLGDVNCDESVSAADALMILQFTASLRTDVGICPLSDPQSTLNANLGDVNLDGNISAVDALFVLQCEVGISNVFCP